MTPEEIAKKLTPAQKRALLWLPADSEMARTKTGRLTNSLWSLEERGLAWSFGYNNWWHITDAGLRVRAILAKEAGDA